MATIATRIGRIEKDLAGDDDGDGADFLLLKPDTYLRAGVPRAEMLGGRALDLGDHRPSILRVYYPAEALDAGGELAADVASLIPDGPDRDELVRAARSARRTIFVRHAKKRRGA